MRLSISEVAERAGIEPSAIRYYERIGLLPAPERAGGKRRYDESFMVRLALIQRARRIGFSLEEIRKLFFGFKEGTPASRRWQSLSLKKLTEVDAMILELRAMKKLIEKMMKCCRCLTLEQCGRGILTSEGGRLVLWPALNLNRHRRTPRGRTPLMHEH